MSFDAHSEATEQTSTNNSVTDFGSEATSIDPEEVSQITEQGVTTGKTGDLTREELIQASLALQKVTQRTYIALFPHNLRHHLNKPLADWKATPTDYKAARSIVDEFVDYANHKAAGDDSLDTMLRSQMGGLSTLLDGLKADKPKIL